MFIATTWHSFPLTRIKTHPAFLLLCIKAYWNNMLFVVFSYCLTFVTRCQFILLLHLSFLSHFYSMKSVSGHSVFSCICSEQNFQRTSQPCCFLLRIHQVHLSCQLLLLLWVSWCAYSITTTICGTRKSLLWLSQYNKHQLHVSLSPNPVSFFFELRVWPDWYLWSWEWFSLLCCCLPAEGLTAVT